MRILYHHRIASKDGQYVHVEEIINALTEQRHEVTIVSPSISESSEFGHDGGIVSKLKSKLPKAIYEIMELSYGLVIAYKLIKQIIKDKPDVIYERYNLYQPVGVFISKLFNIPLLLEVNAPLKQERERFSNGLGMPNIAKKIEDWTWKNASMTLPVSNQLAEHLRQAGVKEDRITIIHNGIKESVYDELHNIIHEEKGFITIGFIGFMHLTCGVEEAIELIAESSRDDIKLICVGDGNILGSLKEKAKKLGVEDKVEFTGLVNRDSVFEHVKKFDIALQPAVTSYASPLKMFEYLAVGSLIVAPNSKNILEILSDDSAVLFDVTKKGAFKESLSYAIENFEELQGRRKNARSLIIEKGFTWQANVRRIIQIAGAYK